MNRNEDQILIPSANGFIRIPAKGLRSPNTPAGGQDHSTAKYISMNVINKLQFLAMVLGMVGLMAYIGYTISGLLGVLLSFGATGLGFVLTSNFSIEQILKRKNVRVIHPYESTILYGMVDTLTQKANLEKPPVLFVDNSPEINAYTVEDKDRAAIVISRGIVDHLSRQEVYGVLAHEVAHLKNADVRMMLFSDQLRRLTGYMSLFGQVLLIINLPFLLVNQIVIPWVSIILLITAPTLSLLFQVAMSRNREFQADLDAVMLAGETKGLTQALIKINAQGAFWEKIYGLNLRTTVPEIFRTHPQTKHRIQRLREFESGSNSKINWSAR